MIECAIRSVQAVEQTLYARVDGVIDHHQAQFRIMELELIEPTLFLTSRPAAAERFADAIATAVRSRSSST